MRDALIKNSAQLVDFSLLFKRLFCLVINNRQELIQRVIPLSYSLFSKFPKRQFLFIIPNFPHMTVHHSDVEDQFDQLLHSDVQFWRYLQLLISLVFLVLVIVVVVHFHHFVMAYLNLVLDHLVVVTDWGLTVQWAQLWDLASDSHAAPSRVHVEFLFVMVHLQDLDDEKLVVVTYDVWLG